MEEAFTALLNAHAGLIALVKTGLVTRIYWVERPQSSALPSVTLQRIDGIPDTAMRGKTGLCQSRVQVDCWGKTYTEAKAVARQIKGALSGHKGGIFKGIFQVDERDGSDAAATGGSRIFRVSIDFIIWHEES
jgi:hypothetical protein